MKPPEILAELFRNSDLESLHLGAVAVADAEGKLVRKAGDPELATFWRSSMKPVQALALAESGALEAFSLPRECLAIACASHNGEAVHLSAVDRLLSGAGLSVRDLACGVHPPCTDPRRKGAYEAMLARGEAPDARHNNCSGKHAGMLAAAKHRGFPLAGYLAPDHPLQARIRQLVARMTGAREEALKPGVDGCSAPVYRLTLREMATAYARLSAPPRDLETPCRAVAAAMAAHPVLIHAEGGWDTEVMRAAPGKVLSKRGAEGVACFGLPALGLGVAIKALDGTGRATPPAALSVLAQLGVLDGAALERLRPFACPPQRNHQGLDVGELRPGPFRLSKA